MRILSYLLLLAICLTSVVARAQSISLTPTTSNTIGGACSNNLSLSNNGQGFLYCNSTVWAAEPLTIGTQVSACSSSIAGQLQWDGGAIQGCNSSAWVGLGGPGGSNGRVQFNNNSMFGGDSNLVWDNTNFRLGIGSSTPVSTLDLSQNTGAIALPVGTTGQEPAAPITGMLRYNSTTSQFEYYGGATPTWESILGYGGSLTGTVAISTATVNLTTVGTTDWVTWDASGTLIRKSTGGSQINAAPSTMEQGGAEATDSRKISWTGGTPTATGTNTTNHIFTYVTGFNITVPASTTTHTLILYLSDYQSTGMLTAHLSDAPGTAFDYVDFSATDPWNGSGTTSPVYTITYRAASAGQTLYVSWVIVGGADNSSYGIRIQAAALQ